MTADPRLAELREHVALNYTTDARVAIAWAIDTIDRMTAEIALLQGRLAIQAGLLYDKPENAR